MLVIRLQRVGRKNDPAFRLVVTEKRSAPKSGGTETLGSYHPKTKHTLLHKDRILYWLGVGAQLSPTAHNLLVRQHVIQKPKINVVRAQKITKPEAVKAEEKPEETKTDEIAAVSARPAGGATVPSPR